MNDIANHILTGLVGALVIFVLLITYALMVVSSKGEDKE